MLPRRLLRGHRVVGRRRHLQVGVIGHGNMGRGVAASLARAGHDVVVYDAAMFHRGGANRADVARPILAIHVRPKPVT